MATGTEIGNIFWALDLDDKKFKSGMSDSTDASQKFTKAVVAGLAVAGAAAVGFGVKSVNLYKESQQNLAQLSAAIKSTGDASGLSVHDFEDQANALQNLTGISNDAIISADGMLSTFTEIKGGTMQQATQATVDMATAINGGLTPSAEQLRQQAMQLGIALNDPTKGMARLHRVGVEFTDAQKEQIKTMQAAGDTAGAQAVILKELQKEFGGSAEAAGKTFAGQINIAKSNMDDFMKIIGKAITDDMGPMIDKFNTWFQSIGGADGAIKIVTKDVQEFSKWLQDNQALIFIIAGVIGTIMVNAFVAWAIAAATAAFATLAALAPLILIGIAIGLVIYAVKELIQNWDKIKARLEDNVFIKGLIAYFHAWKDVITDIFNIIKKIVDAIGKIGSSVIGKIAGLFGGGKATGGPVGSGTSYLVGEQGPEIFTPSTSGRIIPNNASQKIMGASGGGTNISISSNAFMGSPADARRFAERIGLELSRVQKASA